MMASALVLAALFACVALAELLVRTTRLHHFGSAFVVILVAAVAANLGIIPAGSTPERPEPVYDAVLAHVAPLAIFLLLLRVQLRKVLTVGPALLGLFLIGALGTLLGALAGLAVAGRDAIGPFASALTGMFAATYIGGSVNFNALALHYGVAREGALYAGATAVDAGLTALWMIATLGLPRWLGSRSAPPRAAPEPLPVTVERGPVDLAWLATLAALAIGSVWASEGVAAALAVAGVSVPPILVLTTVALAAAQVPAIAARREAEPLGMLAVLLFLAVIGALCDGRALAQLGGLGIALTLFAGTCILVHAVVLFGAARVLRQDPALAAIASQANIGGGTTALAVARSLGREDLVLAALLVGALGNAIGTYVGFFVAEVLL
jgi:uncharacterized membrane protein